MPPPRTRQRDPDGDRDAQKIALANVEKSLFVTAKGLPSKTPAQKPRPMVWPASVAMNGGSEQWRSSRALTYAEQHSLTRMP
jgi:hypothetical protein